MPYLYTQSTAVTSRAYYYNIRVFIMFKKKNYLQNRSLSYESYTNAYNIICNRLKRGIYGRCTIMTRVSRIKYNNIRMSAARRTIFYQFLIFNTIKRYAKIRYNNTKAIIWRLITSIKIIERESLNIRNHGGFILYIIQYMLIINFFSQFCISKSYNGLSSYRDCL